MGLACLNHMFELINVGMHVYIESGGGCSKITEEELHCA